MPTPTERSVILRREMALKARAFVDELAAKMPELEKALGVYAPGSAGRIDLEGYRQTLKALRWFRTGA